MKVISHACTIWPCIAHGYNYTYSSTRIRSYVSMIPHASIYAMEAVALFQKMFTHNQFILNTTPMLLEVFSRGIRDGGH